MSRLSERRLKKLNRGGTLFKNVDFSNLCTFTCGGRVKILLNVCTLDGFLNSILYLQEIHAKYYIIGNGSNILCSDSGYDGVVIKFGGDLQRIENDGEILECGAGVRLSRAYAYACNLGLSGLECGAGIPATIGGATYMNAGAFGFEMSKVVEYVVAFVDGKITYFDNSECDFMYRHSIFQDNNGIILRVGLKLEKKDKEEIVSTFLSALNRRKDTQPLDLPSAGSVFRRLDGIVVSKLLDDCGVKGMTSGNAMVSPKHANFIVNLGGAKAQDIYNLIRKMQETVLEKTGIEIHTEIQLLGEFDEITR